MNNDLKVLETKMTSFLGVGEEGAEQGFRDSLITQDVFRYSFHHPLGALGEKQNIRTERRIRSATGGDGWLWPGFGLQYCAGLQTRPCWSLEEPSAVPTSPATPIIYSVATLLSYCPLLCCLLGLDIKKEKGQRPGGG